MVKVVVMKYSGTTVHCNGECRGEVKRRVQAEWSEWSTGIFQIETVPAGVKGEVYKMAVRPGLWIGDRGVERKAGRGVRGGRGEDAAT